MPKNVNTKTLTTSAWGDGKRRTVPEPTPTSGSAFRNLNNEVAYILQGYPLYNAGTLETNATARSHACKADYIVLGAIPPSGEAGEAALIAQLRGINSNLKIGKYTDPRYWYDGITAASESPYRTSAITINTNSAPALWTAKTAAGATLAHFYSPTNSNGINLAAPTSSRNALNQTLQQAFRAAQQTYSQLSLYDSIFFDDSNVVPNSWVARGTTTEIDWSYLQNGVDSNYLNYTLVAAWQAGIRALVDEFRAISSGFIVSANTEVASWYAQYKTPYDWSGGGRPPTPFSSTGFYELVDIAFDENSFVNSGFGGADTPSVYPIRSFFKNLGAEIFTRAELFRQHAKPAADSRLGARMAILHNQLNLNSGITLQQIDHAYARACWAMTKLVEGVAYGNVRTTTFPYFLDETCIKLGAVVNGARSMGTLNQPDNSSNDPVSFTVRNPDTLGNTNSNAKFWWAQFENAIVVWRGDYTGLTPGSSNFGSGSAATYTLPSPGTGKKWKRPNCASYVHPDLPDLAMENQSPSLNNGADATTGSLLPLHGEVFLRVNV